MHNPKVVIEGKLLKVAKLADEWYEDMRDPEACIAHVRALHRDCDILTFWQRLPDVDPRYSYPLEWDAIAALPVTDYAFWWEKQIDGKTRNVVRRSAKTGVVVKKTDFDTRFIAGLASIFNETPVRQGKRFWHYGKDEATIKREFSRFLFREEIFGAYHKDELIGFIMLAFADKYAALGQILSKVAHRDKAPNNALLAAAVARCAERGMPHLVYAKWEEGTLGEFKQNNGFQKINLPRYFVPLTLKGRVCLRLNLHHGIAGLLPTSIAAVLKRTRKRINNLRMGSGRVKKGNGPGAIRLPRATGSHR